MYLENLTASLSARREQIQASWASALAVSGTPLPEPGLLAAQLQRLTSQLIAIPGAVDQGAATELGRAVVLAGLDHPAALAATLAVLRDVFWEALPDPTPRDLARQVEAVLSAIVAGFSAASVAVKSQHGPAPNGLVEPAAWDEQTAQQAAALRARNEALAKADQRKDALISVLSHELRTPLSIILGLSELLADEAYGPLSADQAAQIGQIERSGKHLLGFVNDVLDLAHLSAGLLELDKSPVDVALLCQMSVDAAGSAARDRAITLDLDLDPRVATLVGDQRRLHQILTRLLGNAVRFTPEGGHAGLAVRSDAERSRAHFTIWDTGSGLVSAEISQLFRPFDQLDSSTARRGGGLGLGLALVASLIRLHGGEVAVESEPGQGSRFSVWLPWGADPALEARESP